MPSPPLLSFIFAILLCLTGGRVAWASDELIIDPLLPALNSIPEYAPSYDAELRTLLARFQATYVKSKLPASNVVQRWINEITPDGRWPDIEYKMVERADSFAIEHLSRLELLAQVWAAPQHPLFHDETVATALRQTWRGWFKAEPYFPNQWWWIIGVPKRFAAVLFLAQPVLTNEQFESGLQVMRRADEETFFAYGPNIATGANLTWVARLQLEAGILDRDMPRVIRASRRLAAEISIGAPEGLQIDGSFHQHGPQPMNGSYGVSFFATNAVLASLVRDSHAAFPAEKLELLEKLIVDGSMWMRRSNQWFFNATGRSFSRGTPRANDLALSITPLLGPATESTSSLKQLITTIRNPDTQFPLGHRHFWLSDFTVHHQSDFSWAVRATSTRTIGSESGNGENLLGFYLGDGFTQRLAAPPDSREIAPLLNWKNLPGVTCIDDDEPLPSILWGKGARGGKEFAGGLSDGQNGVTVLDYDRAGVTGQKAWFFLGDLLVMLGTNLRSQRPGLLQTTLEQTWLAPNFNAPIDDQSRSSSSPDSVTPLIHGNMAYHKLDAHSDPWHFSVEQRVENRGRINSGRKTDQPLSGEIFTLSVRHGESPENGTYAVAINPTNDLSPLPRVLANLSTHQAVFDPDLQTLQAVFWQTGTLISPWGKISVNQSCIIQIKRDASGFLDIHAARPIETLIPLQILLEIKEQRRSVSLEFPTNAHLGSTVRISLH